MQLDGHGQEQSNSGIDNKTSSKQLYAFNCAHWRSGRHETDQHPYWWPSKACTNHGNAKPSRTYALRAPGRPKSPHCFREDEAKAKPGKRDRKTPNHLISQNKISDDIPRSEISGPVLRPRTNLTKVAPALPKLDAVRRQSFQRSIWSPVGLPCASVLRSQ